MESTFVSTRVLSVGLRGDTVCLTLAEEGQEAHLRLRLTLDAYRACGTPKKGTALSCDAIDLLRAKGAESEAVFAAERALASSPKSARELYRNLRGKRHSHENALYAVQTAREKGWLREEDQLSRILPYLAERKLWGERRLLPYLMGKGYEKGDIERALDTAEEEGTLDFDDLRTRLLAKYEPQSEEERKKLLYTHGFDVFIDD